MGLSERQAADAALRCVRESGRDDLVVSHVLFHEGRWAVLLRTMESALVLVDPETGEACLS